jgi:aminopeptidase
VADQRVQDFARILLDTCIRVQPGWQVIVNSTPLGRPLVEELARGLGERGAYALLRLNWSDGMAELAWIEAAPLEVLAELPDIDRYALDHADALIAVIASENTRAYSAVDAERVQLLQKASRPAVERLLDGTLPWVGCYYPTPAVAQDAEMSLRQLEDFFFGAVLLDWEAERERMQRYCDRFDAAEEVRIVGEGTDLRLSLAGRTGKVDAGGANMPGGEFFFCPLEDSAEGVIDFCEFPGFYSGREIPGIRLRLEGGRVVEATAERNEDFLVSTLDTDEGARRVGELGIGCNPGITRYMKNVAYDEKIDGTVHIAVGNGFPFLGGTNESAIHWDIVKDLRGGGRIELDGEVVQQDGRWLV